MISRESLELFVNQYKSLAVPGHAGGTGVGTVGIVVNTDDPLQQGRLQVFCPALNDNPKKIQHLPWCVYMTPFGGSISHEEFARGVGGEDVKHGSVGAIHYGFWAIPDVGAHVVVGCVDGDQRRRIWMGCLPEHQETHTILGGRFDWSGPDGTPDGPFTSAHKPIQPLYDNMTAAFGDRKSDEWKTRGADYQATAILSTEGQAPNDKMGPDSLDGDYENIAKYEDDEWVKEKLGAHGYDWSGFKDIGAMKASRVFGFGTPGMHFMSMDDRPFNSRMKFQTATGHMILLDDTNERIYIKTNKGNNWVEMDTNGNIDVFSTNRVSVTAAKDINLTTEGTIRMYAGESIHMFAGHTEEADGTNTSLLQDEPPIKGEIRIHADRDLHQSGTNIRQKSAENTYHEAGINHYHNVGDSMFTTVQKDMSVSTVEGDHMVTSGKNIYATSTEDTKHLSKGKSSYAAVGDMESQSFTGSHSTTAAGTANLKSMNSDVAIQAGEISGTGSVALTTPQTQQVLNEDGHSTSTTGKVSTTGNHVEMMTTSGGMEPGSSSGGGIANKIIIGLTDIQMHSPLGDIIQKTALVGHSYNKLANKVDELAVNLDVLTKHTSLISDEINDALGGFTPPVIFDLACLASSMYGSLPTSFTDLFPSIGILNDALALLGYAATTLEELGDLLNGNTALLSLLGLPTDLSFPSFGTSCTDIIEKFTGAITEQGTETFTPIPLRSLINSIFAGGSVLGTHKPLTTYDDESPIVPPPIGPPL